MRNFSGDLTDSEMRDDIGSHGNSLHSYDSRRVGLLTSSLASLGMDSSDSRDPLRLFRSRPLELRLLSALLPLETLVSAPMVLRT